MSCPPRGAGHNTKVEYNKEGIFHQKKKMAILGIEQIFLQVMTTLKVMQKQSG